MSAGEVLVRKCVFPRYTAVNVWDFTVSVELVIVACPALFSTAEPTTVVPSWKVTVPAGTAIAEPTVAVKVTACPRVDGLTSDISAVVVLAL